MIKKSIVLFIMLTIAYLLLVKWVKWPSKTSDQWEDNKRVIETFLFEKDWDGINTIILGSSMSYRMTTQAHQAPDSIYNLSLGGQGIYEGFEVLKRSGYTPAYLFIETNILYKEPFDGYVRGYFAYPVYQLKTLFAGFRTRYKPVTFIQYAYFAIISRLPKPQKKIPLTDPKKDPVFAVNNLQHNPNSGLKEMNLERIAQSYNNIMQQTNWDEITQTLNEYIRYFEKKGSTVIFYRMPMHESLCNNELHAKLFETVNQLGYNVLPIPAGCNAYTTTDGVHLKPDDALAYLITILKRIN